MRLFSSSYAWRLAALVVVSGAAGGCTDFSKTPESLGHLLVSVKDEAGVGVPGAAIDLYLSNKSTLWARLSTTTDGSGEFRSGDGGVIPQAYIVRFVSAANYTLAADETNDKTAQVVIGQTITVNFKLVKRVVGPVGG